MCAGRRQGGLGVLGLLAAGDGNPSAPTPRQQRESRELVYLESSRAVCLDPRAAAAPSGATPPSPGSAFLCAHLAPRQALAMWSQAASCTPSSLATPAESKRGRRKDGGTREFELLSPEGGVGAGWANTRPLCPTLSSPRTAVPEFRPMQPSPFLPSSWKGEVAKREMVLRQGEGGCIAKSCPVQGHLGPKEQPTPPWGSQTQGGWDTSAFLDSQEGGGRHAEALKAVIPIQAIPSL